MVKGQINTDILRHSRETVDPGDPDLHQALYEMAVGAYKTASDPYGIVRIRHGERSIPASDIARRAGLMKATAFIAGHLDEHAPMGDFDHPEP